ncbi:MarR-like DNA-binding transcriptional regulator SgrR of sgrS sRNA [Paenibacillus castaneae]|uniref:ABC transporter substrate-binding protein n=1 Tax=Paenibacillus castaneae TaxID=474957 RepID=UPI000C9C73FB|nr:ABC transporter substrate-binding protein [Paenibacillus castaneae]NIK75509.1 MarR-like DNA-binding transcriptional regulator SgrR of sgrS sRNA [Paenibacillus castaneae]
MDNEVYYERLRDRYSSIPDRQPFKLPIDQLADVLRCTRRNAQLVLKKLCAEGYIDWTSGRGRGHQSELTFLISRRELLFKRAQNLVLRENIREAWQLLGSLEEQAPLREQFAAWLTEKFGVSTDKQEKDILRFPFYRPVYHLDPAHVHRRTEAHWIKQVMNTLVDYSQQDQQLRPQLAHLWEANDDYTEWTFYLRKGVRFHNGKLLSAQDIVYTFNRILLESSSGWMKSIIRNLYVSSKLGITFQLTESNRIFPNLICTERYSIVPEGWTGENNAMPIGTGPFQIVKNNDSMLTLEANEYYFDGRPYLDRIEMWVWPNYDGEMFAVTPDKDVQLLYSEGQMDNGINPTLSQLEQGSVYLSINRRKNNILQDERIRRAIHLGIDRERMIEELGGIRQQPSNGFIPSINEHVEHGTDQRDKDRLDLARHLITSSAYAGETLTLYTYEMRSNEENAIWVREACEKLGLRIEIVVLPIEQLSRIENRMEADMILAGEVLGEQPDITLIEMYRDSNGYIRNHLSADQKKALDERISYCLRIADASNRMAILTEVQEQLKSSYSLLFLHHNLQVVGHHRSLDGITMNAWGKINYKNVWVRP